MSLSVGTDSYVTLAEAENLISSHFLTSDATRKAWDNTEDEDKEIALRRSCRSINNLKFAGRRKSTAQILEFPRVRTIVGGVGYLPFVSQFMDNWIDTANTGTADGLNEAKLAQVINAAYSLTLTGAVNDKMANNIKGLTSRRQGPLSESYGNPTNTNSRDAQIGIFSKEVYAILTPWICDSRVGY